MASAVAPGVALTSALVYWASLQGRLDAIARRVRSLNSELRTSVEEDRGCSQFSVRWRCSVGDLARRTPACSTRVLAGCFTCVHTVHFLPLVGMKGPARKISISMPAEDVQWAERRAKEEGRSLSSVVTQAVEDARRHQARLRTLDWLGPETVPTDEEAADIRRLLRGKRPRQPPKRRHPLPRSRSR